MTAVDLPASEFKVLHKTHPSVRKWLMLVAFMTFCMVLIGGLTRLTDSGLSITEWQPIMGALPPLNEADWNMLFEKYKQTTEFQLQNKWMQLADFKPLFWWEWGHRFFGRLIGVVFIVPFLYFLVRRRIEGRLIPWLVGLLALGASQGALGWFMVQSGLTGRTDVSQYRLAAHLVLASVVFALTLWIANGIGYRRHWPRTFDQIAALLLLVLVFSQVALGGFVAGLDAVNAATTWPTMNGMWVPDGLWSIQPAWRNVFENALTVHFLHRAFAYVLLLLVVLHALRAFNMPAMIFAYAVFAQACVGVMVVLMHKFAGMALMHQAIGMLVVWAAVSNLHRQLSTKVPDPDQQ